MNPQDIPNLPDKDPGKTYIPLFKTTQWTVILNAGTDGSSFDALSQLCNNYYSALRTYLYHCGYNRHEAEELLHYFFVYFLNKKVYEDAKPERGRFRCFILAVLKHFLAYEYRRQSSVKGGYGQEKVPLDEVMGISADPPKECIDSLSPDLAFDRKWAWATVQIALEELRRECEASGKDILFQSLKLRLMDDSDTALAYATLATTLGKTEKAIRNDASRLRQRFHRLLYLTVKRTLLPDVSVEDEMDHLMNVLRGK
jgi:DNA-directed RNA polymerase specialized sigma24 family protein